MEDQENATRRLLNPAAAAAAAKTFAMAAGNTGRPPSAAPRATLGVLSGNSLHARANNAGVGANGAMMAKTLPHNATNTAKVRTPGGTAWLDNANKLYFVFVTIMVKLECYIS